MERRKIQLIAGTTYTISLPKEWVKKNSLREGNELTLSEANNKQLIVAPFSIESKKPTEITLNIDEYINDIDQVLFAIYYIGIETINLFSKKELTKEVLAKIRKALVHMSGTEISYEDKQKITIKVLLDKSKVDIIQTMYRISLIINSSISNMLEGLNIDEVRINESEIDRLYHLTAKIITLSLIDSSILQSSKIKNVSLVSSYFLIGKKLENIADNLMAICEYINKKMAFFDNKKEILNFIQNELSRSINYIIGSQNKIFERVKDNDLISINKLVLKIKDKLISNYLEDMIRYIVDIEEEVVIISFYNKLIRESLI